VNSDKNALDALPALMPMTHAKGKFLRRLLRSRRRAGDGVVRVTQKLSNRVVHETSVDRQIAQFFLQALSRAVQPRVDGGGLDAQDGRDLRRAQLLEVEQHDHLAVARVERLHRVADASVGVVARRIVVRGADLVTEVTRRCDRTIATEANVCADACDTC
jgi:hypothetical protein